MQADVIIRMDCKAIVGDHTIRTVDVTRYLRCGYAKMSCFVRLKKRHLPKGRFPIGKIPSKLRTQSSVAFKCMSVAIPLVSNETDSCHPSFSFAMAAMYHL